MGVRQRGLSIAETVLGATIAALLALAVLTLLPSTMGLVQRSRETNVATYLAHDTLELLAARPFAALVPGPADTREVPVPAPYRLQASVEAVDGFSTQRLKRLRVSVSWPYRQKTLEVEQELYVHGVRR